MTDQSEIVRRYCETKTKLHMTLSEAEALSIELAQRIRKKVRHDLSDGRVIVVGIPNGGLMVAKIVSEKLDSPFETIRIRHRGSRLKRKMLRFRWMVRFTGTILRMNALNYFLRRIINNMNQLESDMNIRSSPITLCGLFNDRHVILIDDCIQSGRTVRRAKNILFEGGAKHVTTGVITLKNLENDPFKADQFEPIIYLNRRIQHYPWSQNNPEYNDFLSWLHERGIKAWM